MTTTPAAPAISSSTPILDRQLPTPPLAPATPRHQRVVTTVAYIFFLVPAIWLTLMLLFPEIADWAASPNSPINKFIETHLDSTFSLYYGVPALIWACLSPLAALFMVILVHELGHALTGVCTGFRILGLQIGSLQVGMPFRVRLRSTASTHGTLGFVVLVPKYSQGLRKRALAMFLAGPFANLIAAFVVIFLISPGVVFSLTFVPFSILCGLVNLIPFRGTGVLSDGMRILMLLRNSHHCERWLALMRLRADLQAGVQVEDLSAEFISVATSVQDDSPDTVAAHRIAYAVALRKKDAAEAARLLEVCLQYSGFAAPVKREGLFAIAAAFQAERRKRPDLAEQWLADIPEKPIFPENRLTAQGAILQAQGDIAGALKKLDESEAMVLERAPSPGKEAALRALQKWRSELLEQTNPQG